MKRLLLLLALLAVLVTGLAFVAEWTFLQHARAAQLWAFPSALAGRHEPPAERLGQPTSAEHLHAQSTLLWLTARVQEPRAPAAQRADEDWLRRQVASVGLLAMRSSIVRRAGSTLDQARAALHSNGPGFLILSIGAENLDELCNSSTVPDKPTAPTTFDRVMRQLPSLRLWYAAPARLASVSGGFFPAQLWPFKRDGTQHETQRYATLETKLASLRTRARILGTQLVLFYVPSRFEVDDEVASSMLRDLGLDSGSFETRRLERRLTDISTVLALPWINPRHVLRRLPPAARFEQGERLQARWSKRARRACSKLLAQRLRELFD